MSRPPSGMRKDVTGDEPRRVGAEEAHGRTQFVRFSEPSEWDLRRHLRHGLAVGEESSRKIIRILDIVRADRVDRDAIAAEFERYLRKRGRDK